MPGVQSTVIPTAPIGVLFSGDSGVPDGVLQESWPSLPRGSGLRMTYSATANICPRGMGYFLLPDPGVVLLKPAFPALQRQRCTH